MNVVIGNKVKIMVTLFIKRLSRKLTKNHKINVVGNSSITTDKKIKSIFVINLDRQADRWKNSLRFFS